MEVALALDRKLKRWDATKAAKKAAKALKRRERAKKAKAKKLFLALKKARGDS